MFFARECRATPRQHVSTLRASERKNWNYASAERGVGPRNKKG
jgi:hypothetical protein